MIYSVGREPVPRVRITRPPALSKSRGVIDSLRFQSDPACHFGSPSSCTGGYWEGWLAGQMIDGTYHPRAIYGQREPSHPDWPDKWWVGRPQPSLSLNTTTVRKFCQTLAKTYPTEELWFIPNIEANFGEFNPIGTDAEVTSLARCHRLIDYEWRMARPSGRSTFYMANGSLNGWWTPETGGVDFSSPNYRRHPAFAATMRNNDRFTRDTENTGQGFFDSYDGLCSSNYWFSTSDRATYERYINANVDELHRVRKADQVAMAFVHPYVVGRGPMTAAELAWVGAIHRRAGYHRLLVWGYESNWPDGHPSHSSRQFWSYWKDLIATLQEAFQ